MGDLYYFPELPSDKKKPSGYSSSKPVKRDVLSALEVGASYAKALAEIGKQQGVVCALGLCDERGKLDTEKSLGFLVVASVFCIGLLVMRKVW